MTWSCAGFGFATSTAVRAMRRRCCSSTAPVGITASGSSSRPRSPSIVASSPPIFPASVNQHRWRRLGGKRSPRSRSISSRASSSDGSPWWRKVRARRSLWSRPRIGQNSWSVWCFRRRRSIARPGRSASASSIFRCSVGPSRAGWSVLLCCRNMRARSRSRRRRHGLSSKVDRGRRTIEARLPRVRAGALVLWGREDAILPWTHGTRLARELSGARLEILDCGHFPVEERPQQVESLVRAFLDEGAHGRPKPAVR